MTATVSPIHIPSNPADAVVYVLKVAGMTYPGPFMEGMNALADVSEDVAWDFGSVLVMDPTDGFAVIASKLTKAGFEAL